ncbi:DUF397 domain-containing protein [Yinghuangia soli]|uniref:DUF397 domain-containing protein n=1 Tax=Yinghuangia soli TaxID=2908204 RepID=A0AA41Q5U4_9ACTN|nr:DUF397 domain-containing protein [Yinghuangia soli]MCF2532135.1 DUF397 domain-containing protein [Yinghuangia soli]
MTETYWRKSSYSGAQASDCVEVAPLSQATGVRDSKSPTLGHLELTPATWDALLDELKGTSVP